MECREKKNLTIRSRRLQHEVKESSFLLVYQLTLTPGKQESEWKQGQGLHDCVQGFGEEG